MKKSTLVPRSALALVTAFTLITMFAPAANASSTAMHYLPAALTANHSTSGPLDPATFAGNVLIATPSGDVAVTVRAGQLKAKAASVRAAVARGLQPSALSTFSTTGTCSEWHQAVAGPDSWWVSSDGCAVFGYVGYERPYSWINESDVEACVAGKGFDSSGSQIWGSMGCQDASDVYVPWGNVLAYTQTEGLSLSSVTGAAYQWYN